MPLDGSFFKFSVGSSDPDERPDVEAIFSDSCFDLDTNLLVLIGFM